MGIDGNFITKEKINHLAEMQVLTNMSRKTKRGGTSINLRSLVYDCIRATYFQITDAPTTPPEKLDTVPGFWLMGSVGDAIHQKYQKLLKLDEFEYTEKFMRFKTFSPIVIITKSDGFDTTNHIVYELKTKDKIPDKPYDEELTQCVYNAWLFAYELKLPVYGLTMLYANRSRLDEYELFHYNLQDKEAPNYLDTTNRIVNLVKKMKLLNECVSTKQPPSMDNEFIKLKAFGKDNCTSCVYREVCTLERSNPTI